LSAFVVDKSQIDALLELALCGPARPDGVAWPPFYWQETDPQTGTVTTRELTPETCDGVGSMLTRECIVSVACHYPDLLWPELPGPVPNPDPDDYSFPLDRAVGGLARPTAIEGLKALECYECQSCGHAAWRGSSSQRFCEVLRGRLVRSLPGYDEAPWGQSPPRRSRSARRSGP
jgi:hypothetical protein